ncbi:hypothetical protein PUW25_26385 (plasmid) [Paenibacillus urinalis]|uniref:Uncharacterized protein n=1 Tax=Paenibacillus urinalis TaxID=521520 RepID=A0ABY7XH18_9BACL|nr:hypothetical protein [Paenibacillus urinalis]WDI05101.1 hypothetical protein PUW25_26385 [Paenibacillus urinalis]
MRERIALVAEEVKQEADLRSQIESGEMNPQVYATLSEAEQAMVTKVLFEMSSEKIQPNQGTAALEFILFSFMRIANKQLIGMSLTAEDMEVKTELDRILGMHQITDGTTAKADWLINYLEYAHDKSAKFLQNRQEHINRKKNTIGSTEE